MPVVNFNGRDFYVDLTNTINEEINSTIWFRINELASSIDDVNVAAIHIFNTTVSDMRNIVCRIQKPLDYTAATQTLLGCLAVVGSVACGAAAVATDGAVAIMCETTWNYTIDGGAADCLKGVSGYVAGQLGQGDAWMAITTIAGLQDPNVTELITNAVDLMCEDVKGNP